MMMSIQVLGFWLMVIIGHSSSHDYFCYTINVSSVLESGCSKNQDYINNEIQLQCGSLMNGLLQFHTDALNLRDNYQDIRLFISMDGGNHIVNNSYHVLDFNSNFLDQMTVSGTSETNITCEFMSGFHFNGMELITMVNITIANCTTEQSTTYTNQLTGKPDVYLVCIVFSEVPNLSLNNINIYTSAGETAIALYNTKSATITNCNFISFNETRGIGSYIKTSTLLVELTYYAVYNDIDPNCAINSANGYSLTITGCTVANNEIVSLEQDFYNSSPVGSNYRIAGKGGGLFIIIKGSCYANHFFINNSTILHNSANKGSGIYIAFMDNTYENQIVINDTTFDSNHGSNGCKTAENSLIAGGGVAVDNYVYYSGSTSPNSVTIMGSQLESNTATIGGGVYLNSIDSSIISLILTVKECVFNNNFAKLGSAVYIFQPHTTSTFTDSVNISFQDTSFTNNHMVYDQPVSFGGYGAVYSYISGLNLENVHFINNSGSALVLMDSYANFSGISTFTSNSGLQGGAIAMLGTSYIHLARATQLTFTDNTATYQGGAMYKHYPVDVLFGAQLMPCFIQYQDPQLSPEQWNTKLHFSCNVQLNGESNSIYATSMLPCKNITAIIAESKWPNNDNSLGIVTDFDPGFENFTMSKEMHTSPGRHFTITIEDLDLNSTISKSFIVTYLRQGELILREVRPIDRLLINGSVNDTFTLKLDSIDKPTLHIEINVKLAECPLGFVNSNDSCVCPKDAHRVVNCTNERNVAILNENGWIGKYKGDIYVAVCPIFYCQTYTNGLELPHKHENKNISQLICAGNRTGTLCGSCKDSFKPALNSWQLNCVKCAKEKNASNFLKYFSAAYIPYLLMMAIIILFNIRLTAGPASTLVMYAQMVTTTFDASIHGLVKNYPEKALNTYRYIYGPFNLDFIESVIPPLCFSFHRTLLPVLGICYLLFAIPMVIILTSILLKLLATKMDVTLGPIKRFWDVLKTSKLFKWAPKSYTEVHILALSTIITLSFLKLCIISSFILSTTQLRKLDGSANETKEKVVTFAAEVPIDSRDYKMFQAPAIISEILAVFFIILLLDFPLRLVEFCIHRINWLRRIYPEIMVHSFMNAFNGLYKKNFRIFAGLSFLMRYFFSLVFVHSSKTYIKFTLQSIICFLMILLLFFCWPYKNVKHNYIDLFLLSNLIILNGLGFYQYVNFFLSTTRKLTTFIFAIQYIFTVAPIICLLGYCVFKMTQSKHKEWAEDILFTMSGLIRKWSPGLHQKIFPSISRENEGQENSETTNERTRIISSPQHNVRKALRGEGILNLSTSDSVEVDYSPSVPVTVIGVEDKNEGVATTYQSSHAEGFFLRSEWNPTVYGSINTSLREREKT